MTKAEIASYIGMANAILASVPVEDDDRLLIPCRQALLEAQLILTQQALQEYAGMIKDSEDTKE